jgi:hypothetical protein
MQRLSNIRRQVNTARNAVAFDQAQGFGQRLALE